MVTRAQPGGIGIDRDVLRWIHRERGGLLAVGGTVVRAGAVRTGDEVGSIPADRSAILVRRPETVSSAGSVGGRRYRARHDDAHDRLDGAAVRAAGVALEQAATAALRGPVRRRVPLGARAAGVERPAADGRRAARHRPVHGRVRVPRAGPAAGHHDRVAPRARHRRRARGAGGVALRRATGGLRELRVRGHGRRGTGPAGRRLRALDGGRPRSRRGGARPAVRPGGGPVRRRTRWPRSCCTSTGR